MKNRSRGTTIPALRILCSLLAALAVTATVTGQDATLRYRARDRVEGATGLVVREREVEWKAAETAIVICDMWNRHWCKGATDRVEAMAPRMNDVVERARELGVLIIHAPSDTMESYRDRPERARAVRAPRAANLPEGIDAWCSLDEDREARLPIDDSDGGCDDDPPSRSERAWNRQTDAIEIHPEDAISDRGSEIWNLMEAEGIRNVVLMGVHTNMCVLGRSFGIRSHVRHGKNVVLARDLTDAMYHPARAPFVSHRRGTELVIEHIERYWCPTTTGADLVGDAAPPHVVFVTAEREYFTNRSLAAFSRELVVPTLGARVTHLDVDPDDPWSIPGFEAIAQADLVVLSVRRRALSEESMALLRGYLADGRPLVAIRTSSHAFDTRGAVKEREGWIDWPEFDAEVIGGHYTGHHSNRAEEQPTLVRALPERWSHPMLRGVDLGEFPVGSTLYRTSPIATGAEPLLVGRLDGVEQEEPIAWTHSYRGGRIVYTSLGHELDFGVPAVRRFLLNAMYWALDREVPLRHVEKD